MTDRAAAAAETLAAHGIDPATLATDPLPDASATTLRALVAGPDGASIIDALAHVPTPAVAALLAALEPDVDRRARKAIRLALYRLAQRGVTAPATPASSPRAPESPALDALVSAFGHDGERLLWLSRALPQGALLAYARVDDRHGLVELSVVEVGRKRLRELRRQLTTAGGLRFAPVDWRIADALLVEAHGRVTAPDKRRDYLRARHRFTTAAPLDPTEPVSTRVAPPDERARAEHVAASAALLDEPEILGWCPPDDVVRPFSDEIAAVRASPLLLSRAAQEERVREILRRAAGALVPPALLARRLEGTAYVLAESGRTPAAACALAVATALRTRPGDAADIPLVLRLTERAVGRLASVATAHDEAAGRDALVVTPAEFLREQDAATDRSSSRPGRTRG